MEYITKSPINGILDSLKILKSDGLLTDGDLHMGRANQYTY
jgi:hypothetical protein